ncbi:2-dehydropantoate 2-reductase [Bacillus massiliigorillae]|uniref:2-dehydropantoate 2-reductase n=1 Tax=Bacillus massiliigorillae TaxID=1243664 RepID=UPI0003A4BF35|nr:2-dehydropantoate 2-reductase [Bacillus massiliigorillae]
MRIGIIGGGSIGLLLSAYFAQKHTVTVYTRSEQQAEEINSNGLCLEKDSKQSTLLIEATPLNEGAIRNHDLIIIAVKQYHLPAVIPYLTNLHSKLLFVQNGMGHLKYLEALAATNEVYVGVVEHGALKKNASAVLHSGEGIVKIASYSGELDNIHWLKELPNFPFQFEVDYTEMLTRKLIVNAMINPLTAIFEVTNGTLLTNPYYNTIFINYFKEIASLLAFKNPDKVLQHVLAVCEKTAKNRSSMLRDIEEKRPTEIDSILGYILELAEEKQAHAPITHNLYCMIKGKEYERKES